LTRPAAIAIDSEGNAWFSTFSGSSAIFELSNSGSLLSGLNGYVVDGVAGASSVAIDGTGNVWTTASGPYVAVKVSNSGMSLAAPAGYGSQGIAVDGADNVWVTDITNSGVREVSNSGSLISGTFAYNGGGLINPANLALDGSGDIWVIGNSGGDGLLFELIGAAAPVVMPLATGVRNNTLGTRP
jgi:streptogramin lyase